MVNSRMCRYSFTSAHKNEFKMTIQLQDIQFLEDFVLWSPKFEPDRPVGEHSPCSIIHSWLDFTPTLITDLYTISRLMGKCLLFCYNV